MTFQINRTEKDEIPKIINGDMIKHGINKIEDCFSHSFPESGQEKFLRTKHYYL